MFAAILLVFLGGFAIMVLEIVGARYLSMDFGGAFYVWISQIGVIMIALAAGYLVGGILADRFTRATVMTWLLVPSGLFVFFIPNFSPRIIEAIIMRHPLDQEIPGIWLKLDPVLGSVLIFLLPCFVLAMMSPYMIRLAARRLGHVGRISGSIYAAATLGSIAGVFVSGYIFIDYLAMPAIFRWTGVMTIGLGLLCWLMDRWLAGPDEEVKRVNGLSSVNR